MLKSKWRVAGLVVGLGVLIAILLLVLVHTPPARRYALKQLQDRLTTQDIKLDARQVSYNLVTGSVTLTGVRVSSVGKGDLPPFAEARQVSVQAGLLSLLRGMIHVERAQLDRVTLRWVTTETGRTNLPDLPGKIQKEQGALPEFLVSSLAVNHFSVLVDNRQQLLRVELPDAHLRVTGRMPGFTHKIELALSAPGQVRIENRSLPIDELSLTGGLPGNLSGASVDQLLLRSGASTLRLAGRVDDLSHPRLDISADARLDLPQLSKVAQLSDQVGGTARVRASVKGQPDVLIVDGRLEGENLGFGEFRKVSVNAGFRWDQSQGQVEIASLALQSPLGSATGKAHIVLAGSSWADLVVHDLDLRRLLTAVDSSVFVASRATGKLRADWQGLEIANAAGDADFSLTATIKSASRNTIPLSGRLSVRLESDATIAFQDIRFPGFEASGRLALTSLRDLTSEPKANLGGQINGQVTDLKLLLTNLEAFSGTAATGSLERLRFRGSAVLSSSVAGTLNRPALSVKLDAPSIGVMDFDGISLAAETQISPDQMKVSRADATWKGQSASVEGTIGFGGTSPVLDLRSIVTSRDLAEIVTTLGWDIPVKGQGQVIAAVQGTAANPRAQFSGQVQGIELYQEGLGTATLEGSLSDRVVWIKEIALQKPGGPGVPAGSLTATGSYQLDSGAYEARLASQNLRLSHLNLPGSVPVSGDLRLTADGTGTVEDPRLDFQLETSDLTIQDRPMGRVKAAGHIRNRHAEVSLEAPTLNVSGRGSVSLDTPYAAEAEIKADRLDLSKLPADLAGKAARRHDQRSTHGSRECGNAARRRGETHGRRRFTPPIRAADRESEAVPDRLCQPPGRRLSNDACDGCLVRDPRRATANRFVW